MDGPRGEKRETLRRKRNMWASLVTLQLSLFTQVPKLVMDFIVFIFNR